MSGAEVRLWGTLVGAVALEQGERTASFEYSPELLTSGVEPSPISLPLRPGPYRFPALADGSFRGLPGLLADSLPDRFGNALIDSWLAKEGRTAASFDPVERLCYVGRRGIGALEYYPLLGPDPSTSERLDLEALVTLAGDILSERSDLIASLEGPQRSAAMAEILRVGTSAGGARPKALVALDPETEEVRSGQLELDQGFEHWILKFDGVEDRSRELGTARGYGAIEYAYARMAVAAAIEMSECRLLAEGGRRHFMTRRFDRTADGSKLHMQSLAALAHLDYQLAGAHSYEQAFGVIRALHLPMAVTEQQFRRMVFNLVARNQDDHVKNLAFLMDRDGNWSLSPAFDLTYAYNPDGRWTARHQMSANGKREGHVFDDLVEVARFASIKRGRAAEITAEVVEAVSRWPQFAAEAGVGEGSIEAIASAHRLDLRPG